MKWLAHRSTGARALALGILVVLTVSLLWPWLAVQDRMKVRLENDQRRLAQFVRLAGHKERLQDQIERAQKQWSGSAVFLKGDTTDLAAVDLQNTLKRQIGATGGSVLNTQVRAPEEQSGHMRIHVRAQLRTSTDGLGKLLAQLENSIPIVFVDGVTVGTRVYRAANARNESLLDVTLDVSGYMPGRGE